jgi:uncharacterized protein (TIGR02284 family)
VEHRDAIATLNRLIETCRNAEKGFEEAADKVNDSHLNSVFLRYSEQRAQFALQLQQEVTRIGGRTENSSTPAGTARHRWIRIESAIAGASEHAIILECERGETIAKEAYEAALNMDLPSDVRLLIERQYMQVKDAHDTIRSLEAKLG